MVTEIDKDQRREGHVVEILGKTPLLGTGVHAQERSTNRFSSIRMKKQAISPGSPSERQ